MERIVGKDPWIGKRINEARPAIDKRKIHCNRPRPKVLAKKMGVKMKDIELKTMKTPSYPSGHSVQAYLMALTLSDKSPKYRNKLMTNAKDISYIRRVTHAHYK